MARSTTNSKPWCCPSDARCSTLSASLSPTYGCSADHPEPGPCSAPDAPRSARPPQVAQRVADRHVLGGTGPGAQAAPRQAAGDGLGLRAQELGPLVDVEVVLLVGELDRRVEGNGDLALLVLVEDDAAGAVVTLGVLVEGQDVLDVTVTVSSSAPLNWSTPSLRNRFGMTSSCSSIPTAVAASFSGLTTRCYAVDTLLLLRA